MSEARVCERDGCQDPGREYFITGGVVHVSLVTGPVAVGTNREGNGFVRLCPEHALRDLGVAFP